MGAEETGHFAIIGRNGEKGYYKEGE